MGFRLREVLENFFTVDDLNMAQLTQKMQKKIQKSEREKNAKNTLTSHHANGHGDPCGNWVI